MKALCINLCHNNGTTKRDWYPLRPDGRAGIGPWSFDYGPVSWITPGERPEDRVIDSEDVESIRSEIAQYGVRHLRSFLIDSGLAVATAAERFNHCNDLTSPVDFQYDHPGSLAIGVRRQYHCPELGLSWLSESSH